MKILFSSLVMSLLFSFATCGQKVAMEPCFTDRVITEKLESVLVKCLRTGEQHILVNEETNSRYAVCNSEEFEIKADLYYVISGTTYEMKPNERWPGTPLQLAIVKKSE
jgi:hypothetical protein